MKETQAPQTTDLKDFYEDLPYPNIPVTTMLSDYPVESFKVSFTSAQYARTRQIVSSEGAIILNAGCGSGWETLMVAAANPGAKIVGVDISPASVKLADLRLKHHGYWDSEFYVLDILKLDQLNMKFDFISCNDVLYLLDSPSDGLKSFAAVLKPEGIIYSNLHHYYSRRHYLEIQSAFKMLGLYDLPRTEAVTHVREFVASLNSDMELKRSWSPTMNTDDSVVMNNFLLVNDKGFTIDQMFAFLKEAGLDLITMADFGTWDLKHDLAESPEKFKQKLDSLSMIDLLRLYELLRPMRHRLLNFWAEKAGSSIAFPWSDEDWMSGVVQLNPVLTNSQTLHKQINQALKNKTSLRMQWLGSIGGNVVFSFEQLSWLSRLLLKPMPVLDLIQVAAEVTKTDQEEAKESVLTYLQALEEFLLVMLQPQ